MIYAQHKGHYDSPRIASQLYIERIETNICVVASLMHKEGIVSQYCKKKSAGKQQKTRSDYVMDKILQSQFRDVAISSKITTYLTITIKFLKKSVK